MLLIPEMVRYTQVCKFGMSRGNVMKGDISIRQIQMFHHMACWLVRQARVYYGKGLCHVRSMKLKLDGLGRQFGRFTHTARISVTLGGTMQNVMVGSTMLQCTYRGLVGF